MYRIGMQQWVTIPTDETLRQTVENLAKQGITADLVATKEEAKHQALALLPEDAEVMNMTSVTLTTLGIEEEILNSGKYNAIKNTLAKLNRETDDKQMRQLGAAPDYAIGSVHAVTEEGEVLIASNTGSQLAAYVYGAGQVIWVVGAQKVVANREEGIKRIYEHSLPLESERARKAYGMERSNVSKILIVNKEVKLGRIHLILVKEVLGF